MGALLTINPMDTLYSGYLLGPYPLLHLPKFNSEFLPLKKGGWTGRRTLRLPKLGETVTFHGGFHWLLNFGTGGTS